MSSAFRLAISPELRRRILAHAAREHPAECCGLLIGSDSEASRPRQVSALFATANVAARPRDGFMIDPAELLAAERMALALGLEILGTYHSHPQGPAWLSRRDQAGAAAGWSCVLVDGRWDDREAGDLESLVRSFRVVATRSDTPQRPPTTVQEEMMISGEMND
jgi:proteasome lid subunit RPN8/RPN11